MVQYSIHVFVYILLYFFRLKVGQYSIHGDFEVGVKCINMSDFPTHSSTGKATFLFCRFSFFGAMTCILHDIDVLLNFMKCCTCQILVDMLTCFLLFLFPRSNGWIEH